MLHAPLALSLSLPFSLSLSSFSPTTIAANFPQRALSAQKKLHKAEAREFSPFPANFPAAAELKRISDLLGQVSVNSERVPQLVKAHAQN